jgi:hypothetical protein
MPITSAISYFRICKHSPQDSKRWRRISKRILWKKPKISDLLNWNCSNQRRVNQHSGSIGIRNDRNAWEWEVWPTERFIHPSSEKSRLCLASCQKIYSGIIEMSKTLSFLKRKDFSSTRKQRKQPKMIHRNSYQFVISLN